MPSIPTYIRMSDLDSYLAILAEGKGAWTQFVHQALRNHEKATTPKGPKTAGTANGQPGPEAPEQESPAADKAPAERFDGPIAKADSARKKK